MHCSLDRFQIEIFSQKTLIFSILLSNQIHTIAQFHLTFVSYNMKSDIQYRFEDHTMYDD
jgi:hypothetical protein